MAKGVVLYPAVNLDVSETPASVLNYGVDSAQSPYKCCVWNRNNHTQVPVVYGGKVGNGYAAMAVKDYVAGAVAVEYAKPGDRQVSITNINAEGSSAGLSYRFANGFGGASAPLSLNNYEAFTSIDEMAEFVVNVMNVRIEYIGGVVSVAGPTYVQEGSEVKAFLSIPRGVTVTSGNITVKKNGLPLSFTYSNGILTFTA